jgi:FMN-dependent oxidoreductase (nitrilotriacetate monooxygenase family)
MAKPFHLGWFLDGFRVPAWNREWSGTSSRDWQDGSFYVDMARALERACFDYFMIEDSNYVPDVYAGSTAIYLKVGQRAPKHDPAALAAVISQQTKHIGIVATMATTEANPFALARTMSTLDHLSHGRIGWNMVTGSNDRAAQNFGHDRQPEHDTRYDMADEFVDLVRKLWASWEDDAAVLDEASGIYVDHTKVTPVNHRGKYFASRGPLNTLKAPQGRPVFVQAGISGRGREFAARNTDSVIATAGSVEGMKALRQDLHSRLIAHGREPSDCKILFLATPVLADTDAEATERLRLRNTATQQDLELGLGSLSSVTTIDLSRYDLDEPLPETLTSNGHQGMLEDMVASRRTLRDLVIGSSELKERFVGSPATVAAQMDEVMQEVGGDGFLISHFAPTRRYIMEIADGLVPALQRRGLVRTEYSHLKFRDNLLDF